MCTYTARSAIRYTIFIIRKWLMKIFNIRYILKIYENELT